MKRIVSTYPWIASITWGVIAFVVLYARPLIPEEQLSRTAGALMLAILNVIAVRGLLRYANKSGNDT